MTLRPLLSSPQRVMQKLLNPMRHELLTEELLEIFSRSLSSHPHQYVPPLQQPCWAHVGHVQGSPATLNKGMHMELCFSSLPQAILDSDLLTTPMAGGPTPATRLRAQATFKPSKSLSL